MRTHRPDCRWERTTSANCAFRETHEYCPHPHHACTCPPDAKLSDLQVAEQIVDALDRYLRFRFNLRDDSTDKQSDVWTDINACRNTLVQALRPLTPNRGTDT